MNSRFEEPSRDRGGWTPFSRAGAGILRIALLFGSVAIALTLLLVPVLERRTNEIARGAIGIDSISTGSVGDRSNTYTIRRSVFQPRNAVCVIREDGTTNGAC